MPIVIARGEVGFLLRDRSFLRKKGLKLRRAGQLRQALNIAALLQYRAEKLNASLFLRNLGPGIHKSSIEIRELLLTQADSAALDKAVISTELGNRFLRRTKLGSQFYKTIAEPRRSSLGSLEAGVELFNDVGFRNCVGESRRPSGVNGRNGDDENVSLARSTNRRRPHERAGRGFRGPPAKFRVGDER